LVSREVGKLAKELAPMVEMIRIFSRMLNMIAEFEEAEGKNLEEALKESLSPDRLAELSKQMPPDLFGEFMASVLRLVTVMVKARDFMQLPPSGKRSLASELEEVAMSLERAIEKFEGQLKEARKA